MGKQINKQKPTKLIDGECATDNESSVKKCVICASNAINGRKRFAFHLNAI